jgi:GNAT superfamily N-acetyltransferase
MEIVIAKLPAIRIGQAARLLALAFRADPVITFYLNGSARRSVAFPAFFRALLCEGYECGFTCAAFSGERLIGVAHWIPPEKISPSPRFQRRARLNHFVVRCLFPGRSRGLYRGFERIATLHPHEPHWYLFLLGVDPAFQGKGVGRKLMSPVLELADGQGVPCYLETPFAETHRFYASQGFELGPPQHHFEGAPCFRTMFRAPQQASQGGRNWR